MDYKKKLKTRFYLAVVYMLLGICMIVGGMAFAVENEFISAFGFAMLVMGLVRLRNYFIITKSEERIKKQEIAETDERNLAIINKARSAAFISYFLIGGAAVIVLSFLGIHEAAKWVSYSVMLLVMLYWISYLVYRKKC